VIDEHRNHIHPPWITRNTSTAALVAEMFEPEQLALLSQVHNLPRHAPSTTACPKQQPLAPMPPAARLNDLHTCPMQTPAVPPVPHVGGPVIGPGCVTVLIGGLPAAVLGDSCVCVGPPDSIIKGSATVLIGGKPAARMGDSTAHGGTIVVGCPTVMIGG
jgi:uncharacterized Zn-binding protein involved in type VI secretion